VALDAASSDGSRRDEILDTAGALFAASGPRTSLKDIADACGILPGSLYHHFDSKDAIVAELIERARLDMEHVAADARAVLRDAAPQAARGLVVELAEAIAACAVRNRGALLLATYVTPSDVGSEEVGRVPAVIQGAMSETLRALERAGSIRSGVDLTMLAERICLSMLRVGIGVFRAAEAQMPAITCGLLLDGLALEPPDDAQLDRSDALAAAQRAIATWPEGSLDQDERVAMLRAVARSEFGRRGFEATTIRDLAAAAGMSTGSVYRLIGSKEELLTSVMRAFVANVNAGWKAVLESSSTAIEKLDALSWVVINALDRFGDEFRIQLAWLRESPPTNGDWVWSYTPRLREIRTLVAQGARRGELRLPDGTADARAECLLELMWMPERLVTEGTRAALTFERDTLLRGAATRP
jgi:AcrR family transcriptional regulator